MQGELKGLGPNSCVALSKQRMNEVTTPSCLVSTIQAHECRVIVWDCVS